MKHLFCLIFFWTGALVHAQTSEQFRLESELEERINSNLKAILSTQLNPTSFQVATKIRLEEIKTPALKKEEKSNDLNLSEMGLADVDVLRILESYEREIEQIKKSRNANAVNYRVAQMSILVGVSDLYDTDYVQKLNTWLKDYVQKNYGKGVSSLVTTQATIPSKEKEKSWIDWLKDFEIPLAALILALAALMASIIYALISKTKSPEPISEPSSKPELLEPEVLDPEAAKSEEESLTFQEVDFFTNSLERLRQRIHAIALLSQTGIDSLASFWIQNEERGLEKVCCLIESLEAHSNVQDILNRIGDLLQLDQEKVKTVNAQIAAMPISERIRFYEGVYWDLISFRILGDRAFKQPFSFLESRDTETTLQLVLNEEPESKSVVMAFLNPIQQKRALEKMSLSDKKELVENLINSQKIPLSRLTDYESAMQIRLAQANLKGQVQTVNLTPKVNQVLDQMSIVDQLEIVYGFFRRKDRIAESLKENFFSLAFLPDWNENFSREFMRSLSPEEAFALHQQFPSFEPQILPLLGSRTSSIVQSEIQRGIQLNETDRSNLLISATQKGRDLLAQMGLELKALYQRDKNDTAQAA